MKVHKKIIMSKKNNFYQLPLNLEEDENGNLYGYSAWSKTGNFALSFDFDNNTENEIKVIKDTVNGDYTSIAKGAKGGWTNDTVDFYYNGLYKFCVRGWGGLTGGLGLKALVAAKIQDDFCELILKKLNND